MEAKPFLKFALFLFCGWLACFAAGPARADDVNEELRRRVEELRRILEQNKQETKQREQELFDALAKALGGQGRFVPRNRPARPPRSASLPFGDDVKAPADDPELRPVLQAASEAAIDGDVRDLRKGLAKVLPIPDAHVFVGKDEDKSKRLVSTYDLARRAVAALKGDALALHLQSAEPEAQVLFNAAKETGDLWRLAPVYQKYPETAIGRKAGQTLGMYHISRGRYDIAEQIFNELVARKDTPESERPMLLINASLVQARLGNTKERDRLLSLFDAETKDKGPIRIGDGRAVEPFLVKAEVLEMHKAPVRGVSQEYLEWLLDRSFSADPAEAKQARTTLAEHGPALEDLDGVLLRSTDPGDQVRLSRLRSLHGVMQPSSCRKLDSGARSVSFSAKGDALAVTHGIFGASVTILDAKSGAVRSKRDLPGQSNYPVLSPDFQHVIDIGGIGSRDVRRWRTGDEKSLESFVAHPEGASSVAFTPKGDAILSGTRTGVFRMWDAKTRERRGVEIDATNHGPVLMCHALVGKDAGELITVSQDEAANSSQVCLWDTTTGKLLHSFSPKDGLVHDIAVSPDGSTLAYRDNNNDNVVLWDIKQRKQLKQIIMPQGISVQKLAISPDNRTLAISSYEEGVMLWDMEKDREQRLLPGLIGPVTDLAFSPDGTRLAASSTRYVSGNENLACLWDLAPRPPSGQLRASVRHSLPGAPGGPPARGTTHR